MLQTTEAAKSGMASFFRSHASADVFLRFHFEVNRSSSSSPCSTASLLSKARKRELILFSQCMALSLLGRLQNTNDGRREPFPAFVDCQQERSLFA